MKKLIAFALVAIAASLFADKATFPYDVDMTPRISADAAVAVSDSVAELTGDVTPASDTVAELNMSAVTFTAIDAGSWNEFVDDFAGAAAMLAIKADGANTNWFGYSGTSWVELDGPDIDLSSAYDVKIGFDKTAGSRIRYSVKASGADAWTDLASGGVAWLEQGGTLTQLSKVVLKGTGSVDSGVLASGVRGAYADIASVVEKYSFDYSNVVFTVKVNEGAYGDRLKITVGDKVIEQGLVVGDNIVDFTDKGLVPGSTYDCRIEVVKDGADPDVKRNDPVSLSATADWFGFENGEFVKAQGTNVAIVDEKFGPADESQPAVITPNGASAANARSTVEITVDYSEAFAETTAYDDVQSALALTSTGWQCLADGVWTVISNVDVPTAAGAYATRAEFDYTVKPGKVRFSVRNGDVWYVMKDGGTEWFALAGSADKLNGTSFVGGGRVSAIAATYTSTEGIDPTVSGSTLTLAGSTDVKLADVAAGTYTIAQPGNRRYSMKWTDSADKHATINADGQLVVSSGAAANGIDSYDSYALGLDSENAASKPVLDAAQNASGENVGMKVANVAPKTDVADVTMKVVETAEPAGDAGAEYEFENGIATIPLPAGVKYYKVKISIKTK